MQIVLAVDILCQDVVVINEHKDLTTPQQCTNSQEQQHKDDIPILSKVNTSSS